MRTLFIVFFVGVVSLIVYNPEMDDFKSYIETQSQKQQFEEARSSIVTRMTERDAILARSQREGYAMERNNFLIFSTYRVTSNASGVARDQGHFLGIAGLFFELSSAETLSP